MPRNDVSKMDVDGFVALTKSKKNSLESSPDSVYTIPNEKLEIRYSIELLSLASTVKLVRLS